ncbi:hypothetical protein QTN47_17510 [Danxiaibacter flavus]|uniref:RES domain-containing protein n=1 Tax=Danxiaibacter flavus TaxID=3049108 RepID=A0ABV3ZJN6_9BACT|nr:hypothetical protein QNM32_17520 [Chitinophagaceae bacterium DXS]
MKLPDISLEHLQTRLFRWASDPDIPMSYIEWELERYLSWVAIPHVTLDKIPLLRARPNDGKKKFHSLNDLSYPPDAQKIRFARANYEQEQVFYAALVSKRHLESRRLDSGQTTAVMEVGADFATRIHEPSALFTVGSWYLSQPVNAYVLPFTSLSFAAYHDFNWLNLLFYNELEKICKGNYERFAYSLSFLNFMSDVFCQQHAKYVHYRISAPFFKALMKLKLPLAASGLIYPSANTNAQGMNIVLPKELVDDGTIQKPYSVIMYIAERQKNKQMIELRPYSFQTRPKENGYFNCKVKVNKKNEDVQSNVAKFNPSTSIK